MSTNSDGVHRAPRHAGGYVSGFQLPPHPLAAGHARVGHRRTGPRCGAESGTLASGGVSRSVLLHVPLRLQCRLPARVRDLGYVEGQNVVLEYRSAEGLPRGSRPWRLSSSTWRLM